MPLQRATRKWEDIIKIFLIIVGVEELGHIYFGSGYYSYTTFYETVMIKEIYKGQGIC